MKKKLNDLFRKKDKWSIWIPFGNYTYGATDYIVFAKKNLKTGIIKFKAVKVQGKYSSRLLPNDLIDVKEQWEIINN